MKEAKAIFKGLIKAMDADYGVPFSLDEDDLWFICPSCAEPILYEDWLVYDIVDGITFTCPVCEEDHEL